ncbi:type VI secretion system baseplate subunit TssG [Duganella sp. FT3S]|uniref:Type VI secretion system baseplate subunit TssG n=1 Tax=Rugamonas fusca TaxID=2758568 RepID=A0A7W2I8D0_9BURK|nr:type VI secretion system baseplate subunit TssG [Rugamonas fusca]MBA5607399.1 type VI secretion system baseplate subunit TssG [Rugamonas fusca]
MEMPTAQRRPAAGIIERMLEEPQRFEFVQAVRLLEDLLVAQGVPRTAVLRDYLHFDNSMSLSFPASQIEALRVEAGEAIDSEAALHAAAAQGKLKRIRITPAFMGLLGAHGALPNHYTERIAAWRHDQQDDGPRAFIDLFSNRMVALFWLAWRKHRLELPQTDDGRDGMLPRLLALSGNVSGHGGRSGQDGHAAHGARTVPDEVAAYYATAFRQRPVSAVMVERVLAEYFAIPVRLTPSVGRMHALAPQHITRLNRQNNLLGRGATLGPRMWRRDLVAGIRLGPLERAQYEHFIKGSPGAAALHAMLAMFDLPTLRFEVEVVLRKEEMRRVTLGAGQRLGVDAFVFSKRPITDWGTSHYVIDPA